MSYLCVRTFCITLMILTPLYICAETISGHSGTFRMKIECPKTVQEWVFFRDSLKDVTEISAVRTKSEAATRCAQLSQDLFAQNPQLEACLQRMIDYGKGPQPTGAEFFVPDDAFVLEKALLERSQKLEKNKGVGQFDALIKYLSSIPGASLLEYRSTKKVPIVLATIPQKDGSTLMLNLEASNIDVVPIAKYGEVPKRTDAYGLYLMSSVGTPDQFAELRTGNKSCLDCHLMGYIPIQHQPQDGKVRDLLNTKGVPEDMLAAIDKKFTGNYHREAPAGVAPLGAKGSKFRDEQLLSFLKARGVTSPSRVEVIRKAMNCTQCHKPGETNSLVFFNRTQTTDGSFHFLEHTLGSGRMPGDVDLTREEGVAMAQALEKEYWGNLKSDSNSSKNGSEAKDTWQGTLLESLLAVPCPKSK